MLRLLLHDALRHCPFPSTLDEFCVRENSNGDDGAKAIAGILSNCDRLQSLDVAHNNIRAGGAIALASALRKKEIRELDFSRNHIGRQGAMALAEILNSATIRRFKIENCSLGPEGIICLARSLKRCSSLLELNISGNNIESRGAIAIAECLSQCRNLQVLHFNYSACLDNSKKRIGQGGCCALAETLNECKNLHVLDIRRTDILKGNSAVHFLRNCVHLQKLSVRNCSIGSDCIDDLKYCVHLNKIDIAIPDNMVEKFCFLLRNFTSLSELFFADNYVDLESAKILSESLYYCSKLEVLDVSYAFRFVRGCTSGEITRCLFSKFVHNANLRSLNIEANFIGMPGVVALVGSLKHCAKLQELSIGSNEIMDEGAIVLAGALKYWPNLRVLRVGCRRVHYSNRATTLYQKRKLTQFYTTSNCIKIDGFTSLGNALKHCPHLCELDVSDNDIGKESVRYLLCSLQTNSKKIAPYKDLNDVVAFKRIY